jgi:hypothetical protein
LASYENRQTWMASNFSDFRSPRLMRRAISSMTTRLLRPLTKTLRRHFVVSAAR